MFYFSKKLIEETILVFKEEHGIELTPEQAQEILFSLLGLFLAYANKDGGSRIVPLGRAEPPFVAFKTW